MKRLSLILGLVLILSFSCDDGSDDSDEILQEENFIPVIELNPGNSLIENGSSLTFSVSIDDQDDFYHFYCWSVNGESCGDSEEYTFSASPEFETSYIVSVAVSDGSDIVSQSASVTVKDKPWEPEPLHIYFFAIGDYPSEENIVREYTATDNDDYDYKMISVRTTLEIYNRDNDPDCYTLGGGYL